MKLQSFIKRTAAPLAALALCAQRSYRTSEHYQAESLARNEMRESQTLLTAAIPLSDDDLVQRLEGI
jgi:hypothetical protein